MSSPGMNAEIKLLEQYNGDVQRLLDQLADADPESAKKIEKELDRKLEIYRKQVELVKVQFADADEGKVHEAALYTFQAMGKFHSVGFMRRAAASRNSLALALVAKQQEKGNAQQALALLEKALSIFDYPGAHFAKAAIYLALKQKQDSLRELQYIITNFQDDEVYVLARQMKDDIENPPKKSGCFIATAAFGTSLAPEVVVLTRFRDDVLIRSVAGRTGVKLYYLISPPIAALIRRISPLRIAIRVILLSPMIYLLKKIQSRHD